MQKKYRTRTFYTELEKALMWQTGVWDKISDVYLAAVDQRFIPVVDCVIGRAAIKSGEHVLDLGTGTGSVALPLGSVVGAAGRVVGHDISQDMLSIAARRADQMELTNVEFMESSAESFPADDSSFDAVLASLSLMYVIDRSAAVREISGSMAPARYGDSSTANTYSSPAAPWNV